MHRVVLGFIFMSLCGGHYALAFDMDACVRGSMAAPYDMSESRAREACEAKNSDSGTADTGHFRANVPTRSLSLDAAGFDSEMRRYLSSGDVKFSTCVEWCADRRHTPKCPAGYHILEESMSDRVYGAYHGRYAIRAGLCIRD